MKEEMLSIVIPTYNERDNIAPLIEEIRKTLEKKSPQTPYEILIIDDNSPDGTAGIVKKIIEKDKDKKGKVRLFVRPEKKGLGNAYKFGLKEAKGTLLMEMDADFSHDPESIPDFLKAEKEGFDIVIGSRSVEGGKRKDPIHRRIFPMIGSALHQFILKSKVRDTTSGYRLYRKSAIDSIDLDSMPDDFSFQVAVLFELTRNKKKGKRNPDRLQGAPRRHPEIQHPRPPRQHRNPLQAIFKKIQTTTTKWKKVKG